MAKKKPVLIDGVEYPVVDNLGYNHSSGCYAKFVSMPDGSEAVARSQGARGPWRFHTPEDTVVPLADYLARKKEALARRRANERK